MANKKKLGKGLNEIFGEDIDSFLDDIVSGNSSLKTNNSNILIEQIRPNPYQPRKEFDEQGLQELAQSIKENGVFQPILIRKALNGYELVAGERRLRASKIAGKKDIPAIIVDFNDQQMMEVSLLENIQRKDLSPIEEAQAYNQLIKKIGYTQEELAKHIGKSRPEITNMLRLLKLPLPVRELLNKQQLTYGQARTLLSLEDEDKIIDLANLAVKQGLSVRQLEKMVKTGSSKSKPVTKDKDYDPYIEDVKNILQRKFSTKVEIKDKTIIIKYSNTQDLNRILELMDAIEE